MANVVKLVARNCGLSEKEARREIKNFVNGLVDGSFMMDDITSYLGVEMDYIEDILFMF